LFSEDQTEPNHTSFVQKLEYSHIVEKNSYEVKHSLKTKANNVFLFVSNISIIITIIK